ncbi:hypothetical protein GFY24_18220 [Nocardia sp. SYP-A9097]|uniref:hypothetical protein n=1 Tax=Nocardia sp. SYP-A9097 TaxID=2663237 RepID=UPI00129B2E76|nr:hypothetical protein [Nocardia sp. SYP-A9097]MRH89360.1 hypothetical protein [Nocardia sp. SYP-A9097]
MTERIIITPSDVRAGGDELLTAEAAFETIMAKLSSAIGANGSETWGEDSYGRQFADGKSGYYNSRSNLLKGGRDMSAALRQFGTGLIDASNSAKKTEFGNATSF